MISMVLVEVRTIKMATFEHHSDVGGGDLVAMNTLLYRLLCGHGCGLIHVRFAHVMLVSLVFRVLQQRHRKRGRNTSKLYWWCSSSTESRSRVKAICLVSFIGFTRQWQ